MSQTYRSIEAPFEISKEAEPTHSPQGYKYLNTVYLKTIISFLGNIPIYVVIEDTFDPWEDGKRYVNRAFHVYMETPFVKALKTHPEYNENLVVEELPQNVLDGFKKLHYQDINKFTCLRGEQNILMEFNYGLVAAIKIDEFHIEILHFCGYENKPTEFVIQSLKEELETDPEFELVGRSDYFITEATPDMIDFYRRVYNGEDPDDVFKD